MHAVRRNIALVIVVMSLASGCFRLSEPRRARRLAANADLIGKWVMTNESIKIVQRELKAQDESPFMVFRADGTCHFHSFVGVDSSEMEPLLDAACRWLITDSIPQQLVLKIDSQSGISTQFRFDDFNGAFVLWQYAGDPDNSQYIDYVRRR